MLTDGQQVDSWLYVYGQYFRPIKQTIYQIPHLRPKSPGLSWTNTTQDKENRGKERQATAKKGREKEKGVGEAAHADEWCLQMEGTWKQWASYVDFTTDYKCILSWKDRRGEDRSLWCPHSLHLGIQLRYLGCASDLCYMASELL